MVEALAAFARGGDADLAADGAWYVANAFVNLEVCARVLGKKEPDLPPPPPGEQD